MKQVNAFKRSLLFIAALLCGTIAYAQPAYNCSIGGPTSGCVGQTLGFYAQCDTYAGTFYWYVDNSEVSVGPSSFSYQFGLAKTYHIFFQQLIGEDGQGGLIWGESGSMNVSIVNSSIKPQIQASKTGICDNGSVTLTVTNPAPNTTYTWNSIPSGHTGSGTTVNFNISSSTTFIAQASNGTCQLEASVDVTVFKTTVQPLVDPAMPYHKRILRGSTTSNTHFWQTTPDGTSQAASLMIDYTVVRAGSYYIRSFGFADGCWTAASQPVTVLLNVQPPLPVVSQISRDGYVEIFFTHPDKAHILQHADYFWVTDASDNPVIEEAFIQSQTGGLVRLVNGGTYYLKGRDRETNTWGPTLTISVQVREVEMNWIHRQNYDVDPNGAPAVIAESRTYVDYSGKAIQTQTRNIEEGRIFITQDLRDRYRRVAGAILQAPKTDNEFRLTRSFLENQSGEAYSWKDFDGDKTTAPAPVGMQPGTVGWYYSQENPDTGIPTTQFPYSRTEFYTGTDEVKRVASPGDMHRLGAGHETLTGTFPFPSNTVGTYSSLRSQILGTSQAPNITDRVTQSVVRDENGKYTVTIADKAGNIIMTAAPGTSTDHAASVLTSLASTHNNVYAKSFAFYLMEPQNIEFHAHGTGPFSVPDYEIEDMVTGLKYAEENELAVQGVWPAGFYRVWVRNGEVTISYRTYFKDVAYNFYDDAGRLRVSIPPNGTQQLKAGVPYDAIEKTTYKYNFQGWLLETTEPDAGTTRYVYRKDGKIRFSQNAQQAIDGRFSYTHYDALGRGVESGEYKGTAVSFVPMNTPEFSGSVMVTLLEKEAGEIGWSTTDKKDWLRTHYDEEAATIPNKPSDLIQQFVRGAISWTENANSQTWYSYDELGRVTWMAQKPKLLNKTFITQYTHDFTGNVLTVYNAAYANGQPTDRFYHHYQYDKDRRLVTAETSSDGVDKKLRATYEYYLHGPLKRIELGDQLQGIDFVYNIHGWLTQINHPEVAQDPGKDLNDVFGMVLDYYESALTPSLSAKTGNPHDSLRIHALPEEPKSLPANHQPLPRFTTFMDDPSGTTPVSSFKSFSAENPHHREMLLKFRPIAD